MTGNDVNMIAPDLSSEEMSRFLIDFRQASLLCLKTRFNLALQVYFPELSTLLYEGLEDSKGLDFRRWLSEPPSEALASHKLYRKLVADQDNLIRRASESLDMARKGTLHASQFAVFLHSLYVFEQTSDRLLFGIASSLRDIDALTGLLNRSAMERDLARETAQSSRSGNPFTLAMIDVDHFKRVNDKYGHAFGDRVLEKLADCFADGIRPRDQVYRYGGEEFLLMLPDTPLAKSVTVLERLRRKVQSLTFDEAPISVTVSIGATEVTGSEEIRESVKRADKALYHAKQTGRNKLELG